MCLPRLEYSFYLELCDLSQVVQLLRASTSSSIKLDDVRNRGLLLTLKSSEERMGYTQNH